MQELIEILRALPFLGDASLVALAFVLLMTGVIVPGRLVNRWLAVKDETIAALRDAGEAKDRQITELTQQMGQLLPLAQTTEHLLRSLVEEIGGDTP